MYNSSMHRTGVLVECDQIPLMNTNVSPALVDLCANEVFLVDSSFECDTKDAIAFAVDLLNSRKTVNNK